MSTFKKKVKNIVISDISELAFFDEVPIPENKDPSKTGFGRCKVKGEPFFCVFYL